MAYRTCKLYKCEVSLTKCLDLNCQYLVLSCYQFKFCRGQHELTVEEVTKRQLAEMKVRVFEGEVSPRGSAPKRSNSAMSGFSSDSSYEGCAICLSSYKPREVSVIIENIYLQAYI